MSAQLPYAGSTILFARGLRASDFHAIDARAGADAEVQAALVLRAEAAAAGDLLHLLLAAPEQPYFGSDGAAYADFGAIAPGDWSVDSVADNL